MTMMADQKNITPPIAVPTPLTESLSSKPVPTICLRNIAVIGAGYVGLSNAILLAQAQLQTAVTLFDIEL